MFDTLFNVLYWLAGAAVYLAFGFGVMLLMLFLGRLGSVADHAPAAGVDTGGTTDAFGSAADLVLFNGATGRPLVTPNAMIDVDGNPHLLVG